MSTDRHARRPQGRPPKSEPRRVPVQAMIPPDLRARLQVIADREGMSLSAAGARAVGEWVTKMEAKSDE